MWVYFLCLTYLPTGPWLKAGVCALITAGVSLSFNWLCRRVVPGTSQPWLLDWITLAWLLVLALVLLTVGVVKEQRRHRIR